MEKKDLDSFYKQGLEENIILYLAEIKNISTRESMEIYYKSKLANEIFEGKYGIENLDYKYLVEDLIENEEELFEQ